MLYAVIKMLRGIKMLRAKNSTSDMLRTWNLHKFKEVRLCLVCSCGIEESLSIEKQQNLWRILTVI